MRSFQANQTSCSTCPGDDSQHGFLDGPEIEVAGGSHVYNGEEMELQMEGLDGLTKTSVKLLNLCMLSFSLAFKWSKEQYLT